MARIALLGGSFNPPHLAHQMICLWALSTDRADTVWLVPCSRHAFRKALAPFEQRLEMCRAAAQVFGERVEVIDVERGLDGRTLNTIERLQASYPEHRFSLLVGADILSETDSWYRFDRIRQLVELVIIGRTGYQQPDRDVTVLPDISSTEVRARLVDGRPVEHLVPAAVLEVIERRHLYRATGD